MEDLITLTLKYLWSKLCQKCFRVYANIFRVRQVFRGSVRLGDTGLQNINDVFLLKTWKGIFFSFPNISMNGEVTCNVHTHTHIIREGLRLCVYVTDSQKTRSLSLSAR